MSIAGVIILSFVLFMIYVSLDEFAKRMKSNTTIDEHFFSAVKEDRDESE